MFKDLVLAGKFCKTVINGDITKKEAINTLTLLIEKSNDAELRKKSIELIQKLQFKEEKVFEILENCLISDKSSIIRATAAKAIISNFPIKCLNALEWALRYDKSPIVFKTIYQLSESKHLIFLRDKILDKIAHIFDVVQTEAEFFLDICAMFAELGKEQNLKFKHEIFYRSNNLLDFGYGGEYNEYVVRRGHVIALRICDKRLKNMPNSIGSLSKLRYLNLSECKINTLPDSFSSLSKLRYLNLSRNQLAVFPKSISELKSLRTLILENNNLRKLSKSLFELKKLKKLLLSWNDFKEIPNLFEKLTHLQDLTIGEGLEIMEESFFDSLFKIAKRKMALKYVHKGVDPNEAPVLGLLEILMGYGFFKGYIDDDMQYDDEFPGLYIINEAGNIVGIYSMGPFPKNYPRQLLLLPFLEELSLPPADVNDIPLFPINLRILKESYRLHVCYKMANNSTERIKYLKKALKLNPRFSVAWYNLADEYYHLGLDKLALDCCKSALNINPDLELVKKLQTKIQT